MALVFSLAEFLGGMLLMLNSQYDAIYIGAGIINVLDAINAQLSGKSVLVIEESSDIGGAWKSIAPLILI